MTHPDVLKLARGLDVAERSAMMGRIVHMSGRTRDRLTAKGVLTPRGGNNWTPLGLAVRDHLRQQGQTDAG